MHVAEFQLPLAAIFTPQVVRWTVWVGLVGLTVALLVLMRTGWGQSQPLRKCIVLSLVAHLLVGIYATTVNIVTSGGGLGNQAVTVSLLDGAEGQAFAGPGEVRPWDKFGAGEAEPLDTAEPEPVAPPEDEPAADLRPQEEQPELPREIVEPVLPDRAPDEPNIPAPPDESLIARSVDKTIQAIDVPPPPVAPPDEPETEAPSTPDADVGSDNPKAATEPPADEASDEKPVKGSSTKPIKPLVDTTADSTGKGSVKGRPAKSQLGGDGRPETKPAGGGDVPSAYKNRFAPNHAGIAQQNGGGKQTEAAVTAALKWLADNQSRDGRWNARSLEAGREVTIHGHDRRGAGTQADTGVTGLALLAFLAAGNTHERGEHRDTVRRGLEFLLRTQEADGSLGGDATLFEKMYCHAMATFAMSEAFAMSRDARLESAARKAVDYCIAAQHRPSGGWRYQPGEEGDTSQHGWQVMALKSAELAGIRIPDATREGMIRYLNTVSSGPHKGLASYRPGHAASRAMTAEALVCRQFLGMARTNPAADEAGDYLLAELPGKSEANLYYWYYATLGMYQLQGDHWQRWNEALQPALVESQRADGRMAGSWDPDAVWGAYGGRVFSTALSTLCLEVYYRYLLQDPLASRDNRVK